MAFAGQIFDFRYSTCAIGAALCLGFHLKDNFRFTRPLGFPISGDAGISSLSTFARLPLHSTRRQSGPSGPRRNESRDRNVSRWSLARRAAWTFVWGLLHGSYLVVERVVRGFFEHKEWANNLATRLLAGFATYAAVCVAWVFFRAPDFTVASRMLGGMFGGHPHGDAFLRQ